MILIGIGANLPRGAQPAIETARWAAGQLTALPGLERIALSAWYMSAPIPPSDQPPYVNAVVRLRAVATPLDPADLLRRLQAIEAEAGRSRSIPNAARTLDLDIIAMGEGGDMVRTTPDPILPHPRAHLRAFVLLPLREVAPRWRHPLLGHDVDAMIAALPPQTIERVSP